MIIKKHKEFTEAVLWWNEKIEDINTSGVDLVYYIHDFIKRGDYHIKFYTSVIDISKTEEQILASFSSSMRKRIRGGLKVWPEYKTLPPTEENIMDFIKTYNEFAKEKNIIQISYEEISNQAKEIIISYVEIDNSKHYLVIRNHDGIYRNYLSCSDENFNSKDQTNAAKANQYLSMLYAKAKNAKVYDMGGLYQEHQDTEKVKGIIEFKRNFKGKEIQIWKNIEVLTKKGEEAYLKYFKKRN